MGELQRLQTLIDADRLRALDGGDLDEEARLNGELERIQDALDAHELWSEVEQEDTAHLDDDLFRASGYEGRATCPDCGGHGKTWDLETETEAACTTCDGLGHVDDRPYSRHERVYTAEVA
ncbi:MAG: hypothetical protein AAFV53_26155 [Myxococcota bacterium]